MPGGRLGAVVLAALAGLLLAACGGGSGPSNAPAGARAAAQAPAACPASGRVQGGLLRVPKDIRRDGRTPLVVVTIPVTNDPEPLLGLTAPALRQGVGVFYADHPGRFFQLNHRQGDRDVGLVNDALDRLLASGCFDARRVTTTGVSNGAGFATRLACALPDRFAAVVAVAAGDRALDSCAATTRTAYQAVHGADDPIVPYEGRPRGGPGNVPRYTAAWARRIGCANATPRATRPGRGILRLTYAGCPAGLSAGLVRLAGTDHGWPGAVPGFPPHDPTGFSATAEVLRVVARVRRP